MKVGIYNQFLNTMGGGERHMGKAAEVLSQAGHEVELITHVPASVGKLASKLHLELDGVRVRTTPLQPFDQLAEMTAEYDLFINASFMSVVPSKAPRSMLIVLFPFPLDLSPVGRWKRRLAGHIHRQLLVPRYGAGLFGPQHLGGSRYRWTGGRGEVVLETPWPGKPLPLRLVIGSFRPAGWEPVPVSVRANGRSVHTAEVQTTPGNYVTLDVDVPAEVTKQGKVTLEVVSPTFRPFEVGGSTGEADDFREVGVAIARIMVRHPRHYAYELLFERLVPELGLRLHGLPDERAMRYLDSYDVICPISEFTNEWLVRYWEKEGTILYPPVDVEAFTPRPERKQIILSVGRFFRGSHNKKHDVMIRVFRQLVREGLRGWELHLAGSVEPGERHERYFHECQRLARDLPVIFHVDAPFAELKELYESSSIYWHAAGYGAREPILFEHFGITPVEAMAGGCVPLLVGKGGLPELVEDGVSGFIWRSTADLKRLTRMVVSDSGLAERVRRQAVLRSRRFGEAVFRKHLLEIADALVAHTPASAA